MSQYKEEYRRHLPHIIPLDGMFHVVFRIKNSIPTQILKELSEYYLEKRQNINIPLHIKRSQVLYELNLEYFEAFERFLHNEKSAVLADSRKATIVRDALFYHDRKKFNLVAYSIMPNHVHLLVMDVKRNLSSILKSVKGFSSHEINRIGGTHGTFWQDENYDHMVRIRNEMAETIQYILNNPVKSGLCDHYSGHDFTWCNPKYLES